jgi:hypothetical protein
VSFFIALKCLTYLLVKLAVVFVSLSSAVAAWGMGFREGPTLHDLDAHRSSPDSSRSGMNIEVRYLPSHHDFKPVRRHNDLNNSVQKPLSCVTGRALHLF